GSTRRVETPLGTMYVTITEDDKGQPFEVFISLGKAGGALMADVEAIGRLISLALRSGIPMREIYRQLRGISSDRAVGLGPSKVLSVPDAIGIAIEKWMQDKQGVQQDLLGAAALPPREVVPGQGGPAAVRAGERPQDFIGACPDCGSLLEHQLLRPLGRLHDGLDQRHAELPLLQLQDAVDGAARRCGDRVLEQGGVIPGFERDLGGAEQRLRR